MHVSETQLNITPTSTSPTMKQDVQQMSVSTQPKMKKITDDNRHLRGLVTAKANDVILNFYSNGQFFNGDGQELGRKFGNATTFVNAYNQQLLDHQPPIEGHPEVYINYKTFIRGMIHNLQYLDYTADLESTTNLRHAITKLPTSDLPQ